VQRDHLALHSAGRLGSHGVCRDRGVDPAGPQAWLVANDDDLCRVVVRDRPRRPLRPAFLGVSDRDADQRHHARPRVRQLGILRLSQRELLADVAERLEHVADGYILCLPRDVGFGFTATCLIIVFMPVPLPPILLEKLRG